MRMQTGFRGFRIDKDREEELESVRAPIPPRLCGTGRRRAPHGTCLQLTRFPDVLRAFDSKRYWTLKELSKRVTQTEVWNCLCTCRVLLVACLTVVVAVGDSRGPQAVLQLHPAWPQSHKLRAQA